MARGLQRGGRLDMIQTLYNLSSALFFPPRISHIFFNQVGLRNFRLALQVSDGLLESDAVILRITATALTVELETANKRASVVQGSFVSITEDYLKASTNAADELEITYSLTRLPKYGKES